MYLSCYLCKRNYIFSLVLHVRNKSTKSPYLDYPNFIYSYGEYPDRQAFHAPARRG